MKTKSLILAVLFFFSAGARAQDMKTYTRIVKELSSAKYQGRGYANNGVNKAGRYLWKEFAKAGADTVFTGKPVTININTFPGKMEMSVDGRRLKPGEDFVMREYSPGVHGTYNLYFIDTLNYDFERIIADLKKPENKGAMLVCDFWFPYRHYMDFSRFESDDVDCAGFIYTWTEALKFYKAYGNNVVEKPVVWTTAEAVANAKSASFNIDNKFLTNFESFNIIARVDGRRHDSCLVFTAHYDHLGNLGSMIYCPGVNDNASGTAAIVTLAAYYAQHQPEFDMWFVAFTGEETGLCGSEQFVKNPPMPLSEIKYLFNLDMIGDNNPVQYCEVSEQGMAGFAELDRINAEQKLFEGLRRGELAGNSDHYPFAMAGVPCILFEQEDGDYFQYYHTPKDDMKHFCTVTYPLIFRLLTQYVAETTTQIPVDFNEGVDLMSIVWRLLGDEAYNYSTVPAYCKTADDYFAAYRNHPVIAKAREVDETSGIGYDAVVSYGLHLIISPDGKLSFDRQLAENGDISFDRWTKQQKEEFLPLLEDFYRESRFHEWYVSTEEVRNETVVAFGKVARQLDMRWFDRFFGPKPGNSQFQVVLSILCGVNNYGCSAKMTNGGEKVSPVISCCSADDEGHIFYQPAAVLPIVVHEFCHSYCNPLNARYWKGMKENAAAIFALDSNRLTSMAYGSPEIMMNETFVRSSVIRYQLSHGMADKKTQLVQETTNYGFLLTGDMVEALGRYEQGNRKSMNEFMPEIVNTVNAFDIGKVRSEREEFARHCATYTCNIEDGATGIPSGQFFLTITFSKPMQPGIALGNGHGGQFPPLANGLQSFGWDESQTVITVEFKLEPHTHYSFSILGSHFHTVDGFNAGEEKNIGFTTGD